SRPDADRRPAKAGDEGADGDQPLHQGRGDVQGEARPKRRQGPSSSWTEGDGLARGKTPGRGGGLRIIAGSLKGRRLLAPRGLDTRPLPDRVKQALFDWLGQRLDGLHVVDCCAGSGAFGFEALSRGAARVDAIESGQHALPVLRANAAKLG